MRPVLFRRRRIVILLVVLVAIFVLLSLPFPVSRRLRKPVTTVVAPVLRGVEAVGRWFGRVGEAALKGGVARERDELGRRVKALEAKKAALEAELAALRSTAEQLEALAEFDLTLLPARVIGRDPTSWYDTALINVGAGRGVREGMLVVRGRRYVGRVVEVGSGWSRVMLLLDARSAVPAMVEGRGTRGLVETTSKRVLVFRYLADAPEVRVGDVIVTARLAAESEAVELHFVDGFEIGTVSTLRREEHGWYAVALEPPSVLNRLGEVLVVVEP